VNPESKERPIRLPSVLRVIAFFVFIYLFLLSIQLMGTAFKQLGVGFARGLIAGTSHPLSGLFIGLLATSVVQSSSCTTSIVVALVASGTLPLSQAIPVVMGANIGTTVTNTLVSMAHITGGGEFRKAIAAATVHDFFNVLAASLILPLELFFHILERSSLLLTRLFAGVGGISMVSPLKLVVAPLAKKIAHFLPSPILTLIVALVVLFLALRYIVRIMKRLTLTRFGVFLHDYAFGNPIRSLALGLVITSVIQSSSVTTSLLIPLAASGLLSLEQIFPFTLGANLGTTVTALLASLVTQNPIALATAFSHLLFNVLGILLIYPVRAIRRIPLTLAERTGQLAMTKKKYAILYLLGLFYFVPICFIFLEKIFGR
jgi:sodium-dependent phosphate cotransporter